MLHRVSSLLLIAAFSVAVSTSVAGGQRPATPDPSQLVGTAHLTGRVVAVGTDAPVRRASVTLTLSSAPTSQGKALSGHPPVVRHTETDANGGFEFQNLPAGSYIVTVEPVSGFVRPTHPEGASLTEGERQHLTYRLERAGAIEGRVQDENGDGLLGAQVHAVRRFDIAGYVQLGHPQASATADDRGAFRLFNLPPGEYYVLATQPLTRERMGMHGGGNVDDVRRRGYANTYYPGSVTLQGARTVAVRSGRDTEGATFKLAPRRLATLSVDPVNSAGVPLGREAQVTLTRRDDVYLPTSSRQTSRREDGTLAFTGVVPGEYVLGVSTSYRREEAAYVRVTIEEQDVSLKVRTNTGARVSGRVLVDGMPAGDPSLPLFANVRVAASPPLGTLGFSYGPSGVVQLEGDRFELTGLRGPMVVSAEVGLGALLSIRRGGEEIAGKTLEFAGTERLDDVVIEVTTKVASLDVIVTGTSAAVEPESVLIILFSEDPSRWRQGYVKYGTATVSPKPTQQSVRPAVEPRPTRLTRMPPGPYRVIAMRAPDISLPTAAALFERLRPIAAPITLAVGESANITIPVSNLSR